MTCTSCHRVNPSGSLYCFNCGAPLPPEPVLVRESRDYSGAREANPTPGPRAAWADGVEPTAPPHAYAHPYYPEGAMTPAAPAGAGRRGLGRLLAPLATLFLVLGKLKFLIIFAKFGKIGLTMVTMLISVVAYASLWGLGWAAAFGFVALLFVHEMGHWVVMRLKGVPASAPIFIPFLGAVIGMRGMPRSVKDEAEIGIAGPIAGTVGALACLGLGVLYGGHLWPLLAMMGLFLNLFNLLPVSPLDGGRIVAAISKWLWIAGLVGLVALFVLWRNPFLLLIGLVGGMETIARFRGRYAPTDRPGYYDITAGQRVVMGALYFGLIAVITVAMIANPLTIQA